MRPRALLKYSIVSQWNTFQKPKYYMIPIKYKNVYDQTQYKLCCEFDCVV